jgi:HD-GYP domain-containing protein (c-di-GMP phosphodiesterase class II)
VKAVIPSEDIRRGMFVTELDRPWLETPFPLQGFLVESDSQIAVLREMCRTVTIDRSHSLGSHFARPAFDENPSCGLPATVFRQADDASADDFAAICRQLRIEPRSPRYDTTPAIRGIDQQSGLEAELLYSAPIVEDAKRVLASIQDAAESPESSDLKQLGGLVREMARGVERNPDALVWLARLKAIDRYSYDHALDVSVHMMVFARFLDLPAATVEMLGLAGLLQDVGKAQLPEDLLNRPGPLETDDRSLVHSHVAHSLEILVSQSGYAVDLLDVVASHHERHDGSGYPRGLKGKRLNLHAEIAGLVDSYCAMIRQRPYQRAVSSQRALESLIRLRDEKFRAAVVDPFVQCLGVYPIGSLVELNSGEVAVVIQQNQIRRLKPRVLLILGPDKSPERRPRSLDLLMEPTIGTGAPYCIVRSLPADAYGIDPAEYYLA